MVQNNKLYYQSCSERYESEETTPVETPSPPKKVSFLERFFIHGNDAIVRLTAGIAIDNSFPGNHWNLR